MGTTSYSSVNREIRSNAMGYQTKNVDQIFQQNLIKRIHESMDPKQARIREARDSATHPNSLPIIVSLDVTGSMRTIPHELIKKGLPTMMSGIIEKGLPDPALLFLAIGDHVYDKYPLQVGQFESGDAELDTWLERTYLEGGGGGNGGESYSLAYYFAGYHTVTDAWEKRNKKGYLFTIGDEPCLSSIPASVIGEIMGETPSTAFTTQDLLKKAQEKYHVYHLHVLQGSIGHHSIGFWKELLGSNCIEIKDFNEIAIKIADIVTSNENSSLSHEPVVMNIKNNTPATTPEQEML